MGRVVRPDFQRQALSAGDEPLIAACERFEAVARSYTEAIWASDTKQGEELAELMALRDARDALARRISRTSAASEAGWRAKARAALALVHGRASTELEEVPELAIAISLAADLRGVC